MSAELCQNRSDQKVTVLHTWAGSYVEWKQCCDLMPWPGHTGIQASPRGLN